MAKATIEDDAFCVDGVAVFVETTDRSHRFFEGPHDEEGTEEITGREATVSILWPQQVSWADVLESPQLDAALALVAQRWGTSRIDVVHERDRVAPDARPVTGRHPDGVGCVDVIAVRTRELV